MDRLTEEIQDLDRALGAVSPEIADESFAFRLTRDSLLRRRDELVAAAAGVLDMGLQPGDDESGAEISLVARVLDSFQESLASIAQVLAGEPTALGLIPVSIKDGVQLKVAEANPGSLNLRLVPANPHPEPERSLFDSDPEVPLIDRSISLLLGLLAEIDDKPSLVQHIADVGPRATGHIQRLGKVLGESNAGVSLSWRSSATEARADVSGEQALTLTSRLSEIKEASRDVVLTGRLVGGSLVRRSFELELEDGSVIAGQVSEAPLDRLARLFGRSCTARIEVREAVLRSGETRESHQLLDLTE